MTAEVLDKFAELIIVALGLVAALAWNTAIQNLFTMIFGKAGSALISCAFCLAAPKEGKRTLGAA